MALFDFDGTITHNDTFSLNFLWAGKLKYLVVFDLHLGL